MPAQVLKYLHGLPTAAVPAWPPSNTNPGTGTPSPFQPTAGLAQQQQNPWQTQGNNQQWWCAQCHLHHTNPTKTHCRICGYPRDPQHVHLTTQRQPKGKGKGKSNKGKGKGKQQSQTGPPTADQLWKEDGTVVWDPAGWVNRARRTDNISKITLFDINNMEVDVEDWLLEKKKQKDQQPIAGPDKSDTATEKLQFSDQTKLARLKALELYLET